MTSSVVDTELTHSKSQSDTDHAAWNVDPAAPSVDFGERTEMVAEHHSKARAATRQCTRIRPGSDSGEAIGKGILLRDCAVPCNAADVFGLHSVRSTCMGWTDAARWAGDTPEMNTVINKRAAAAQ